MDANPEKDSERIRWFCTSFEGLEEYREGWYLLQHENDMKFREKKGGFGFECGIWQN